MKKFPLKNPSHAHSIHKHSLLIFCYDENLLNPAMSWSNQIKPFVHIFIPESVLHSCHLTKNSQFDRWHLINLIPLTSLFIK